MKNKYNQHFVVSKDIRQSVVLLLCNFNSLRYILGPLENGYPGSKDWMVVVLILGQFGIILFLPWFPFCVLSDERYFLGYCIICRRRSDGAAEERSLLVKRTRGQLYRQM